MDNQQVVLNVAKDILAHLGFDGEVSVVENEDSFAVHYDTEETGILIGFHGETLQFLQAIIRQIVLKKIGEWLPIYVDVGDYIEHRQQQLKAMADRIVEETLQKQSSTSFPKLSAKERRLIHIYLEDNKLVRTESVGEDEQRRLVVFPA